jgi:tungstate transport system permease protein
MEFLFSSLSEAARLIASPTEELVSIVVLSLLVSLTALLLATVFGLPTGTLLGLGRFRLRGLLVEGIDVLAGLPPVVVGLGLYLVLSRSGPLGFMDIVYTPAAMVVAQFFLAYPVVVSHTRSSIERVDPSVYVGARTLGASPAQIRRTVASEAGWGMVIAVMIAFGRVLSEVGAMLILGGNMAGETRVISTAIATETGRGEIALVLALGMILLLLSTLMTLAIRLLRVRLSHET